MDLGKKVVLVPDRREQRVGKTWIVENSSRLYHVLHAQVIGSSLRLTQQRLLYQQASHTGMTLVYVSVWAYHTKSDPQNLPENPMVFMLDQNISVISIRMQNTFPPFLAMNRVHWKMN